MTGEVVGVAGYSSPCLVRLRGVAYNDCITDKDILPGSGGRRHQSRIPRRARQLHGRVPLLPVSQKFSRELILSSGTVGSVATCFRKAPTTFAGTLTGECLFNGRSPETIWCDMTCKATRSLELGSARFVFMYCVRGFIHNGVYGLVRSGLHVLTHHSYLYNCYSEMIRYIQTFIAKSVSCGEGYTRFILYDTENSTSI